MHMTILLCRLLVIWFVERDCLLECVRNYWTDTTSFVTQALFQSECRSSVRYALLFGRLDERSSSIAIGGLRKTRWDIQQEN